MKYGCNYSKELIDLLKSDVNICDYIKIGAFGNTQALLDKAYSKKPLLIHGFGWFERGGMPDLGILDYNRMNDELQQYESPFVGMHIMAFDKDCDVNKNIVEHIISNFQEIQESLDVPLLLENMDYSEYYTYETTVKETVYPLTIKKVIEASDAYLLFDLSHARVSAYQLGIDIYDYIDALPLERLKEIHFSGSFYSEKEGFMDIHGIMNENDFEVARYIAAHHKVRTSNCLEVITLEYGVAIKGHTDKEAIRSQLIQLREIFGD